MYVSVVAVYAGLIFFADEGALDAYGVVEASLMALIGPSQSRKTCSLPTRRWSSAVPPRRTATARSRGQPHLSFRQLELSAAFPSAIPRDPEPGYDSGGRPRWRSMVRAPSTGGGDEAGWMSSPRNLASATTPPVS